MAHAKKVSREEPAGRKGVTKLPPEISGKAGEEKGEAHVN